MENELIPPRQEESRLAVLKTSPLQYCKELRPKTVSDVFASREPAIGEVVKIYGETQARAVISLFMADALEFFNATDTMSDIQVAMTVDLIIEEYPYFKTDDLKLCFKNAMKMKYGKLYNRIDGQIIMGWFREYNKERCAVADNQSWNDHKANLAIESKPTNGLFYDEYVQSLKERATSGDTNAQHALSISGWLNREMEKRKLERKKVELEKYYTKIKEQ